jgi:hypothetical protein
LAKDEDQNSQESKLAEEVLSFVTVFATHLCSGRGSLRKGKKFVWGYEAENSIERTTAKLQDSNVSNN